MFRSWCKEVFKKCFFKHTFYSRPTFMDSVPSLYQDSANLAVEI